MKKTLLFFVAMLFLVMVLVACNRAYFVEETPTPVEIETPASEETSPPLEGETLMSEETLHQYLNESLFELTAGVIVGEMFYKDIEVFTIFESPFTDVLGEPLSERGSFVFYDGLEIVLSSHDFAHSITGTDLALFEINGIALNMARFELIATFGDPAFFSQEQQFWNPNDPDDYRWLGYDIVLNGVTYRLEFWFDSPDSAAHNFSLRNLNM